MVSQHVFLIDADCINLVIDIVIVGNKPLKKRQRDSESLLSENYSDESVTQWGKDKNALSISGIAIQLTQVPLGWSY